MKHYFLILLSIPFLFLNCEKEISSTQVYRGILINGCDSTVMTNANITLSRLGRMSSFDDLSEVPAVEVASTVSDQNGYFEMEYAPPITSGNFYEVKIAPPATAPYGYIGTQFWFSFSTAPLMEQSIVIYENTSLKLHLTNTTFDSLFTTVSSTAYDGNIASIPFVLAQGQDTLLIDSLRCGNLIIDFIGNNIDTEGIDTFQTECIYLPAGELVEYSFEL